MWKPRVAGVAGVVACASGAAFACTTPPPIDPPTYWIDIHGDTDGDGRTEIWIGQEVGLFGAQNGQCACGMGFDQNFVNIVTSATITNAILGVTTKNMDGSITIDPIINFGFVPWQPTTDALNDRPDDRTWFGFYADDATVNPADYADVLVKLWFELEIDNGQLGAFLAGGFTAQVAAGEAFPGGVPNFNGGHFADFTVKPVPAPAVLATLGLAGLAGARRRR